MSFCCDYLTCSVSSKTKNEEIVLPPPRLNSSKPIAQLELLEEHMRAIVIDNGSYEIKAGFSGEDTNSYVFRNVDENGLNSPISKGIITNWDEMEKVWNQTFNELIGDQDKLPVFLTDKPLNPKSDRERMTEIMFEKFNVPAMYVCTDAFSSLYSSGRITGVVVQSGYEVTHVVPIYEGNIIPNTIQKHTIQQLDFGGHEHTNYMTRILNERGDYSFTKNIADDIKKKENFTYVADDYENELREFSDGSNLGQEYVLPDNKIINISSESFRCPELLFKPNLDEIESASIHYSIFTSIMNCDIDIRKDLYSNILLAGGNTMFPNIGERIKKEIESIAPAAVKINVHTPPERKNSAWIGGSMMASLSTFQQTWITKEEYDVYGAGIVHTK